MKDFSVSGFSGFDATGLVHQDFRIFFCSSLLNLWRLDDGPHSAVGLETDLHEDNHPDLAQLFKSDVLLKISPQSEAQFEAQHLQQVSLRHFSVYSFVHKKSYKHTQSLFLLNILKFLLEG